MTEQSTIVVYPLDGTNRKFVVPYEYLARSFNKVTLLGDTRRELTLGTDYRFITANQIETTQAWGEAGGYTAIELKRTTPAAQRLVDFYDGSVLRSRDLNISAIQAIHIAAEAKDAAQYTLGENGDGDLDARLRKVVNLKKATKPTDAVPFGQLEGYSDIVALEEAREITEEYAEEAAFAAGEVRDLKDQTSSLAQTATEKATQSTEQAVRSENAADRAETARDAATVNADVYPDVATGRAAVANGEQFQVVEGEEIVRYRRDSASTQTEVARYPSSEKIEAEISDRKALITNTRNSAVAGHRVAMAEVDEAGNVAYAVDGEGNRLLWADIRFMRAGIEVENSPQGLRFTRDGEAVLELLPDGHVGFIPAPGVLDSYIDGYLSERETEANVVDARKVTVSDINHILVSGQSLSVGVGSGPGITTTQPFDNLMPQGGVHDGAPDGQGITTAPDSTAFEPLRFVKQSSIGESIGIGGANFVSQLISDEAPGAYHQLLVSNNGRGATAIGPLSKGGSYYDYGMQQAALYRSRANADQKTYCLQAVWWMQGETDSSNNLSRSAYKTALKKLIDDTNADLPQSHRVPLLTYQMASHTKRGSGKPPEIALAQLEAAREHRDIYLVTPMYHVPYNGDGVHLPSHSVRWIGQYFAKVYKQVCVEGRPWRPLEPVAVRQQGALIDVDFHVPSGPLVLDTDRVTNPGDYGFEVLSAAGELLPIESVTLRGDSSLRIVLGTAPTDIVHVRYAYGANGWQTGPTAGARGCLRDSDPLVSMYNDASGQPYELFNWCVIFNEIAEEV